MTWLAVAVLVCAPAGDSMTATLVEGPVTVARVALATGAVLRPGDTVETQVGGRAEIGLAGGSLLRIGENTRITLSPVPARSEFSARLFFGNLWARVHKLVGGETFRVDTEKGVAGVLGTEFRVEAGQQDADLVRVYEGTVQVEARDGRWSHALEAGTGLRFRREADTPQAFDTRSEGGHAFMEWVRARKTADGVEPGRIRRAEMRNPEQEHRTRERVRRRDR
jgi:ferric-dicitrate binding protein FerR (iron transport regulator)